MDFFAPAVNQIDIARNIATAARSAAIFPLFLRRRET
jgi:hypothetical protein